MSPLTPIMQDTANRRPHERRRGIRPPMVHLATWPGSKTRRSVRRKSNHVVGACESVPGLRCSCNGGHRKTTRLRANGPGRGPAHGPGCSSRPGDTGPRHAGGRRSQDAPDAATPGAGAPPGSRDRGLGPAGPTRIRARGTCAPVRRVCASSSSGCVRRCAPPPWRPAPTGSSAKWTHPTSSSASCSPDPETAGEATGESVMNESSAVQRQLMEPGHCSWAIAWYRNIQSRTSTLGDSHVAA